MMPHVIASLYVLRRHLERLDPMLAAICHGATSTAAPCVGTSHERFDPSAFPVQSTLLFTSLSKSVAKAFALLLRSPVPRVWLPFRRCQLAPNLGNLFQLPTLLGFALQSFHLSRGSEKGFPLLLSALRLSHQTLRPNACLPAAYSPRKNRAPLAPRGFSSGRDRLLSWAFRPLGFLPPLRLGEVFFFHFTYPLCRWFNATLRSHLPSTLGSFVPTAWLSPFVKGADPFGLSHRLRPPPL